MLFKTWKVYQSNSDGGQGNQSQQSDGNQGNSNGNNQGDPESFQAWLDSQPAETKAKIEPLFKSHVEKLENTVKATRQERDTFAKQLRDAGKKLESGSDLQKQLEEMAASFDDANRRADFYEQATEHECKNPKAAYAIAKANDLFTKSGAIDWKSLQVEAPELFGKSSTTPQKKSAGSGTGNQNVNTGSMSDWIRQQAGTRVSE